MVDFLTYQMPSHGAYKYREQYYLPFPTPRKQCPILTRSLPDFSVCNPYRSSSGSLVASTSALGIRTPVVSASMAYGGGGNLILILCLFFSET
jgi:hypothetical protein